MTEDDPPADRTTERELLAALLGLLAVLIFVTGFVLVAT